LARPRFPGKGSENARNSSSCRERIGKWRKFSSQFRVARKSYDLFEKKQGTARRWKQEKETEEQRKEIELSC
jgi:hypothetical protein